MKLTSEADLDAAKLAATRGPMTVPVQVWREGETLDRTIRPGPLGVLISDKPAGQAVRERRELDQVLRRSRGGVFARLHGAGRELQAVSRLFRTATVLKGPEASKPNLDKLAAEGRLGQFRYLHFATHGVLDELSPMRSALILAQDQLPDPLAQVLAGQPADDGRLTAAQLLRGWRLDAELVTLSACYTGLGKYSGGEGYLGFSQALFLSGARSLVLSLWQVDDASTALLMTRFYENLLGARADRKPMSKAQALAEAKTWLRGLKAEEAEQVAGGLLRGLDTEQARGKRVAQPAKQPGRPGPTHPYAHPYYWSGFVLIGDPN
jgi:CHAT domain-containing protein